MKKILISFLLIILFISCNSQKNDNIEKYVNRVFYSTYLDGKATNYYYISESDKGILPISFKNMYSRKVFAYTFITNMPNNDYYYLGADSGNFWYFYAINFDNNNMYEYETATGSYIGIEMHDNAEDTIINELLTTNVYILAEKGSDEEKYIIDIFNAYMNDDKDSDNYVRILYSPDYNPDDLFQEFFGYEYINAFDILFGYNKTN